MKNGLIYNKFLSQLHVCYHFNFKYWTNTGHVLIRLQKSTNSLTLLGFSCSDE